MAMRAIWKGTVGFGLVTVPTKVFTATEDKAVKFARLHGECGAHINMQNFCPKCEKVVEFKELIKGYKLGEEDYLAIKNAELDNIKTKSQGHIDIIEFVPNGCLSTLMLETPYFMAPDRGDKKIVNKGAEKAFALLYGAMKVEGVVGIGKLVMKDKEHLVALIPHEGIIAMIVLRWFDEIRLTTELKNGEVVLGEKEIALAGKLVHSLLAKTFDHAKYTDEYEKRVQGLIQAKIDGKVLEPDVVQMPEVTGDDLIGALMASLNEEVAPVAVAPVAVAPVAVAPVVAEVDPTLEKQAAMAQVNAAANLQQVVVKPAVLVEVDGLAARLAGSVIVAEKPVKPITPMPELPPGQIEVVPDVEAKPAEKELVPVGANGNGKANAKAVPGMVKVEITVTRRGKPFVTSTWKRLEEAQKAGDKITDWGVTEPV